MQLNLLDLPPVFEPEPLTEPLEASIASSFQIGDSVRVRVADRPLPSSLVGQVGIVSRFIAPAVAQIDLDGKTWALQASHLEPVQMQTTEAPKFEIQVGDRVLVWGQWWRASKQLDSGTWLVDEMVREPIPHTRSQRLAGVSDIEDRRTKPAIVSWLEARIKHRQKIRDRFDQQCDRYRQQLAEEKQPHPEEYLDLYPLTPQEVAEFTPEGQAEYLAFCKEYTSFLNLEARIEMLERESYRLSREISNIYRQIYDAWEEECCLF